MLYYFLIHFLFFLLGLVVGSFLNVCIYRIPRNQSIIRPRSRCPTCYTQINWYDNIPLLSYVLLKGKCRYCGAYISLRYPFVEGLTGIVFLLTFWRFGLTAVTFLYLLLASLLILISFIDLDYFIIPNEFTYFGLFLGLISSFLMAYLNFNQNVPINYFGPFYLLNSRYYPFWNAIIGAGSGALILYFIGLLGKFIFKKEAMGVGDIKLIAMLGSFLGVFLTLLTIFLASIVGIIFGMILLSRAKKLKQKNFIKTTSEIKQQLHYIPFGPSLAIASFICLLWGEKIINFYFHYVLKI